MAPATSARRIAPTPTPVKTSQTYYHRNQQYSIVGLTNAAGTLVERYTYSAYGTLGIYAANGTVRSSSTYANRYTYTGREWDGELRLYHFRARWYDSATGGFVSRDPLGYVDGMSLYRGYFGVKYTDPNGKQIVNVTDDEVGMLKCRCFARISAVSSNPKHTEFDNPWPDFWHTGINSCKKLIADSRAGNRNGDPRITEMLAFLRDRNCGDVPIDCTCCESKLWGGGYDGKRKDITICTNNISKDILGDVIYHELIHANQHCYGKNWGPGCTKKFMIEMEAYYCMGWCGKATNFKTPKERAIDCMFKAIGSVCNSHPDKCPDIDVITPEFVADLVKWFISTENNGMCKFFSKYHDPQNGVVELPYTEDWQSTIRCSRG